MEKRKKQDIVIYTGNPLNGVYIDNVDNQDVVKLYDILKQYDIKIGLREKKN